MNVTKLSKAHIITYRMTFVLTGSTKLIQDVMFETYTKNSDLEKICYKCGIPYPDSMLFESSYSSSKSSENFYISRKRSKSLNIITCNFQSIWNKRAELEHFLKRYNIDILLGSETHLSPNITNPEIISLNYSATSRDRDDGYGGVIIISKSTLLVEEIPNKH